ncbi:MAG: serine/threonine protein kinase [Phycisphaeraceae bacterium]|nr:serine/threonine protein kinase [Phycisphaeraceae bacterium]
MAEFHQIAGFDVVATLGEGAASKLYRVRDKHGKEFCLKRVVKDSPSQQRFIDQAVAEYEVSRHLDSPLIRKVHKLIRQRALLRTSEVLVLMELVEGRTIETVKFKGMIGYCKLFHAAAKGLHHMHEAGYIHADIKPNNIMVTREGMVKIIDFGQSCKNGTVKERIQGTPDYIAPEQVKRQPITPKTDLFNLGATMYWLLTGQRVPTMMPRKDRGETIQLRTEEAEKSLQSPIALVPTCPPALSNLILECVAKSPDDRPSHMQEVMDRVEIAAGQAKRNQPEAEEDNVTDDSLAKK